MKKMTTVGLDLAKSVFQVHGIAEEGVVIVAVKIDLPGCSERFAGRDWPVVEQELCRAPTLSLVW
nr:hypothetical protein [Rhizobium etli]